MAIGGGGTPNVRVVVKDGRLVATGNVVNTPASLIYSDTERQAYGKLADALVRLRRGEAIRVDMTGAGQFLRLVELWDQAEGRGL